MMSGEWQHGEQPRLPQTFDDVYKLRFLTGMQCWCRLQGSALRRNYEFERLLRLFWPPGEHQ